VAELPRLDLRSTVCGF